MPSVCQLSASFLRLTDTKDMVDFAALSPDQFEQYLRDCLLHLYDYAFLQDNPLVYCLVPDTTGASRVRTFSQRIKDCIENLRPELTTWERIAGTPLVETDGNLSVLTEVQRAYGDSNQILVDLRSLMSGVVASVQSLADQHNVHVQCKLPDESSVVEVNGTALRQAIIWIGTRLIIRSKARTELNVESAVVPDECKITFLLNQHLQEGTSLGAALEERGTLKHLLETLAGRLLEEPDGVSLSLRIPLRQRIILIVDDNQDTLSLFRRYLIGQPYHVLAAHDGKQAIDLARQSQLSAIILDVMLPDQDGWEILQNLKSHPTTRGIPIVVCSVLNAPDLAYSLGAEYYLKKPFSQADLFNSLADLLG